MITGVCPLFNIPEESVCRTSKDYRFTELGLYKIHSTVLMSNIDFEEAKETPEEIDDSIFINDEETKPEFEKTIDCQNYITTRYIGRAPLEWYQGDDKTKLGRQFLLVCREGRCIASYRVFGTEDAVHGYNRSSNENVFLPDGGEKNA